MFMFGLYVQTRTRPQNRIPGEQCAQVQAYQEGKNTYIFFGGVSAPETIQAATAVLFLIQKGREGGSLKASTPPLCPDRLICLWAKTICSV